MSSLRLVPPVVTITRVHMCFPMSLHSWDVCRASSLVGSTMMAGGRRRGGEGGEYKHYDGQKVTS